MLLIIARSLPTTLEIDLRGARRLSLSFRHVCKEPLAIVVEVEKAVRTERITRAEERDLLRSNT